MDDNLEFFEEENIKLPVKGSVAKKDASIKILSVVDKLIPDPKSLYASRSKLTPRFLAVLGGIVDDDSGSAAWLTWGELVTITNLNLPEEERISLSTWKDWLKRVDSGVGMVTNDTFEAFREVIQLIRIKKKMNIIGNIEQGRNVKGNTWLLSRSAQYRKEFGNEDKDKGGDTNIQVNIQW